MKVLKFKFLTLKLLPHNKIHLPFFPTAAPAILSSPPKAFSVDLSRLSCFCTLIIQVYGDKDDDGFFLGELNGRRGYVPFNMIEELESADQNPISPVKRLSVTEPSDSPDRMGVYSDSLNTTMSSPGKVTQPLVKIHVCI